MMRRPTMWADMKVDCYAGEGCDEHQPYWHIYCDGDKDSDNDYGDLTMSLSLLPPGTKVTVEEPVCPECGDHRIFTTPDMGGPKFADKCECGFDWIGWEGEQWS